MMSVVSVSKAQVTVGPALLYGTNINEPGIQVNGYYKIPNIDNLWAGGDLSFYFPHKYKPFWKESIWELNANARYIFYSLKGLSAYGFSGLDFTTYKFKPFTGYALTNENTYSSSHIGLNLGVGGAKAMKFGQIFAEVKYVVTSFDHLSVGAGAAFPIKTK